MTFLRITVYAREKEFCSEGDEYAVLTREGFAQNVEEVEQQGSLATIGAYLKLEEKVKGRKRKEGKAKRE